MNEEGWSDLGDGMEDSNEHNFDFQQWEDRKPVLGMEFATLDDVYTFYNRYAKEIGFSVRKDKSVFRKNTQEQMMKYYVCSKEGASNIDATTESKRRHDIVRENCTTRIVVLKKPNNTQWTISQFNAEHTHPMTTFSKVHLLRSHRDVSVVKRDLSQQLTGLNVPMCQQISIFATQAGGVENMECTQKDLYNQQRNVRKEVDGHDVEILLEHFEEKKAKNTSFYFETDVDSADRLNRLFWADAISRRAYGFYGDVVVFDTTYNTNRYDMKFAPFMGVNKHGQTTVFACGFLNDETTNSFVWLFDQFKKAMPGCDPKVIITDQDGAINNALAQVFPQTFHRFCIWHILKKFPEKLDTTSPAYDYNSFHKCIWDSESPEEFDTRWNCVVEKTKSTGNVWLSSIFKIRAKWVPAYVNHVFSAGMSSSQQVESVHAFFERYVTNKNSLFDFIVRFTRAVSHQRHAELERDHIDINSRPVMKTPMLIERKMGDIYTRQLFYKFQDELWSSMACVLLLTSEDEDKSVYNVHENVFEGNRSDRKLTYEKNLDYASCTCKKYEFEGIPCRHLLAYLKNGQLECLPNQYINKRWTKIVNSSTILDEGGSVIQDNVDNSLLMKKSKLSTLASKMIERWVRKGNGKICTTL